VSGGGGCRCTVTLHSTRTAHTVRLVPCCRGMTWSLAVHTGPQQQQQQHTVCLHVPAMLQYVPMLCVYHTMQAGPAPGSPSTAAAAAAAGILSEHRHTTSAGNSSSSRPGATRRPPGGGGGGGGEGAAVPLVDLNQTIRMVQASALFEVRGAAYPGGQGSVRVGLGDGAWGHG
jgi:hypothetical protein